MENYEKNDIENRLSKKALLDLLDDEDIKARIVNIVRNGVHDEEKQALSQMSNNEEGKEIEWLKQDNSPLINEISEIQKQKEEIVSENEALKEKISHYNKENNELKNNVSDLEDENKILNDKLSEMTEKYRDFDEFLSLYERYCSLAGEIKDIRLGNVISYKNVTSFIISCTDFDNLLCIWDFCKSLLLCGDKPENVYTVLRDIFYCFFEKTREAEKYPTYELLTTNIGEEFDDQYHIRVINSKVSGKITEVHLKGIIQSKGGDCKRQSIVTVGKK